MGHPTHFARNSHQRIKRIVTSTLLALLSAHLSAAYPASGDIGVNVYGLSYHLDQERARELQVDNQFNPGLGLHYIIHETSRSLWFAEAGAYRDSGQHVAKLVGPGYQYKLSRQWRLGGGLIYFNSKSYNRGRPFVAPVPLLTYQTGPLALNLTYFPKVAGFNAVATFGFYATFQLGHLSLHARADE